MRRLCRILVVFCLTCLSEHCAEATEILFPLNRDAYQTNELIDISVIRSSEEKELAAGELTLRLLGADGSSMTFVFNVNACSGKQRIEHLHVNGRLLRPGTYTIQATVDGQEAKTQIDVYSHIRKSNFKLINWGRAREDQLLVQGEDNIGFNLFYDNYRNSNGDDFIRTGIDYMPNCVMGGGHQMDLRNECDWSNPYVIRGGTRRAVRQVFIERTKPNVPGIHFYDEPGLTWNKHAVTGEITPHGIKSQVMSYESAFGTPAPEYWKIDAGKPEDVAIWEHWAKWKLGFMDAAWQDSQFGVSYIRPDYLSVVSVQVI